MRGRRRPTNTSAGGPLAPRLRGAVGVHAFIAVTTISWIGCGSTHDWATRDCDAEELAFIDAGIALASAVAPEAGAVLAERHPDEPVEYDRILERLARLRDRGDIRCSDGPDPSDEDAGAQGVPRAYADMSAGQVVINTNSPYWGPVERAYNDGAWYGALDPQTVEDRLATADWGEFGELKAAAREHVFAPATAAESLVHETAHLLTAPRYHHEIGSAYDDIDRTDFVCEAGELTRSAAYWQIWMPERQHLDSLYFDR